MIRCFINLLKAKLNNNTNTVKILLQFDNYYKRSFWHFDCLPRFGYTIPTVDPTIWHMAKLAHKHLSNTFFQLWSEYVFDQSIQKFSAFLSLLEVINWSTFCNNSITGNEHFGSLNLCSPDTYMRETLRRMWKWMTPSGFILNIKYTGCSWSHDIP